MPLRLWTGFRLLPFQRPASPEMKLSPSETLAVVGEDGPAWATAGAAIAITSAAIAARTIRLLLMQPLLVSRAPERPGANLTDAAGGV